MGSTASVLSDLFEYQHTGASWLSTRRHALLADEMGLGKTVQAIRAADLISDICTICIVCPAIARIGWAREFERWQERSRSIAVVRSSADLEKPAVIGADVLIVSYSMLASAKARKLLAARRNDLLILDEAHSLKNPQAVRSRAVYGHRYDRKVGLASTAARVWLLSGTIMPNNPSELWTHLHALFGETRRYSEFIRDFCILHNDGFSEKIVGGKNSAELAALLRPHLLRRRVADVLVDLPPLRWVHTVVSPDTLPPKPVLPPEEAAVLEAVRAKLADDDVDGLATDAMHLATLRRWTGVAKAAAVVELANVTSDKVVIFALHRDVIQDIRAGIGQGAVVIDGSVSDSKKTPESVGERQLIIDSFNEKPEPRVLICQLSIASTALTLTAAAHVIFAETSWTPSDLQQAAKRCHRIGQNRPVLAQVVSLEGSIDEAVNAVVLRKAAFAQNFGLALTDVSAISAARSYSREANHTPV